MPLEMPEPVKQKPTSLTVSVAEEPVAAAEPVVIKEELPGTPKVEEKEIFVLGQVPEVKEEIKLAPAKEEIKELIKEEIKEIIKEETAPTAPVVEEIKLIIEAPKEVVDPFMPTLSEPIVLEPTTVEPLSKTTVDKSGSTQEFFEISSAADQVPVIEFDLELPTAAPISKLPADTNEENNKTNNDLNKEASKGSSLSSGGYLAKPAQIYVEETPAIQESNSNEEPLPLQKTMQEDEPVIAMQMVVKDSQKAAEEQPPIVQQTQPIMMSAVEEPAPQDETEELRRRATERIAKLRNLSFNINASDPNNEFETVPAYLRRNMDMTNQIADVENFYSNYTVKSDDNNQAEISTINTFLDGKKPD